MTRLGIHTKLCGGIGIRDTQVLEYRTGGADPDISSYKKRAWQRRFPPGPHHAFDTACIETTLAEEVYRRRAQNAQQRQQLRFLYIQSQALDVTTDVSSSIES